MIFSNVLLIFMIGIQLGSYSMMIENSLRGLSGYLQIQHKNYLDEQKMRQVVPDVVSQAEQVRHELPVSAVAARAYGFAMASSEERSFGIQVTGVQPEFEPLVSTIPGLVKEGEYFTDPRAQEIVVGRVLARNLKVGVGDEVTLLGSGFDGSIAATIVTVVGIFDSGVNDFDRNVAQIPLQTFQDVFAMGNRGHAIVISAPSLELVQPWKKQLQSSLSDSDLRVRDWNALQPGLKQAIQADMSSAAMMYIVLIILVAFSVLNTQLMSVLERTREFGIMLALGLRASRISWLVVSETTLLAGLGLIIGVGFGLLLTIVLHNTGFSYPGLEEMASKFNMPSRIYPAVNVLTLLLGPACVFIGSLLACLYPALKILRLRPVEAMRAV